MDRQDYTVTKTAGPKVAGRSAEAGDTLRLTEGEARAELLAGAIVPAGKEDDPLAGTRRLPGIQARARGLETARDAEAADAETATGKAARSAPAVGKEPVGQPAEETKPPVAAPAPRKAG